MGKKATKCSKCQLVFDEKCPGPHKRATDCVRAAVARATAWFQDQLDERNDQLHALNVKYNAVTAYDGKLSDTELLAMAVLATAGSNANAGTNVFGGKMFGSLEGQYYAGMDKDAVGFHEVRDAALLALANDMMRRGILRRQR